MALNKLNNNYNTVLEIKKLQVNDSLVVGSSITASNAAFVNGIFYVGVDSLNLATVDHYTAPVAIFSLDNPDNYIQMALKNTAGGANSSADYIAYPDNGNDDYGYIDMGITSSGFGDPKFVLTGSNDGYIFMSGVKNTLAVTSATLLNGVVTIVTSTPHGYFQGDTVRLEINNGIVPTAYYAVTIVNIIDRYTFALTTTSSTYVSGILAQITDVYKITLDKDILTELYEHKHCLSVEDLSLIFGYLHYTEDKAFYNVCLLDYSEIPGEIQSEFKDGKNHEYIALENKIIYPDTPYKVELL